MQGPQKCDISLILWSHYLTTCLSMTKLFIGDILRIYYQSHHPLELSRLLPQPTSANFGSTSLN